jgi:mRNA-degrading endonuclease RelE of RelBE toxin-antitoxin system
MTKHLELSRRAAKDLRRLDRQEARRILEVLQRELTAEPPPDNLDIKEIQGAEPYLRLRVGNYRVIYRALSPQERRSLPESRPGDKLPEGYLAVRVIHRRDLERAIGTL